MFFHEDENIRSPVNDTSSCEVVDTSVTEEWMNELSDLSVLPCLEKENSPVKNSSCHASNNDDTTDKARKFQNSENMDVF